MPASIRLMLAARVIPIRMLRSCGAMSLAMATMAETLQLAMLNFWSSPLVWAFL